MLSDQHYLEKSQIWGTVGGLLGDGKFGYDAVYDLVQDGAYGQLEEIRLAGILSS
jgi:hypothetical protein